MRRWEYDILTLTPGSETFLISHSAPEAVDEAEEPVGAYGSTLDERLEAGKRHGDGAR